VISIRFLNPLGNKIDALSNLTTAPGFLMESSEYGIFTAVSVTGFAKEVSATPLPAALPLYATGLGALVLLRWRRKRKAAAA
jgi:hypothetical protein